MARSLAFKTGSPPVVAALIGACMLLIPSAAASQVADLSISKSDLVDPVNIGSDVIYTITVDNAGPDAASDVSWSDGLSGLTAFTSLAAPAGWLCTTPQVGMAGGVSCSVASLPVGSTVFTLAAKVYPLVWPGTEFSNTATVSSTTGDPDIDDLSATETTRVSYLANMSAAMTVAPDPVAPGTDL